MDNFKDIKITEKTISQLKHATLNPVKRDQKARSAIKNSIDDLGMGRSILTGVDEDGNDVIIAGNGTIEQARELGIERVIEIETDGKTIISVKRTDLNEMDQLKMALYDNYTAKNAKLDQDSLKEFINLGVNTEPVISKEALDKMAYGSEKQKGIIDESYADNDDAGFYLIVKCATKEDQTAMQQYLEGEGLVVMPYEGK